MPNTFNYRADAPLIAQVSTVTITAYDVATTYTITINNKSVSVVGQGGSAATTAAALQQALSARTDYEFQEITFTNASGVITMTANTAGKPFTAVATKSGGTGTIGAFTTTTANSGPNDASCAANYFNVTTGTSGALPSTGDTLIFENLNISVQYGLTALAAIHLASTIFRNCTGDFGLPQYNGQYWEYRPLFLQLYSDAVLFDCPQCQLANIDSLDKHTAFTSRSTGTSKQNNLEALLWKGTHASNVFYADRGSIGIAVLAGDVATIATLNQGYVDNPASDSRVRLGSGVTLADVNRIGGLLELNAGMSGNLIQREGAGMLTIRGSGTYPLLKSHSGGITMLGSGTIANMTLGEGIVFDARKNETGFVISNVVQGYKQCQFLDPMRRATTTGGSAWLGIKANGCKQSDLIVDRGPDCTIVS